ncbi:MAG: hypothetical protein ACO3JL_06420 [Myxococcota bacterium]
MAINPTGRGGSIQLNTGSTTVRQSPRTDFGTQMRNGIGAGAGVVGGAVGVAAPMVPGAAVVGSAISGAGQSMAGGGGAYGVSTGDIPVAGPGLNTPTGVASTGNSQQDMINQTKNMQEMMQSFNLQYLTLQEKMQNENRSFTTISNVLKTKHDTAKSSINNVR